ncbi:MAG: D-alanine-D-alanine ligase [Parcubacteria group bacterium GW2011_GWE2_39_37]|uniref:D-alanine-D-alanine ligase n=1 Tax=Candidatus Falkowbacteria bacterium GW2011_GWF2_39_8 TaxID=1618642 RepID=A0A0G0PSS5_9BACT|nr:MAG: D-alanine-D-alanine ligase [Parcubacteria group bacterium GW2011_GWE2_39_37]KKR30973.1 MAG: D-alanine-D-alanine ligase [Candidatus Falkowbacteria bacterium GW2011_GWF2_39_8]
MKKINLAVIFYGDKSQIKINESQFKDLQNNLIDFNLKKYDLNKFEQNTLLRDFKAGIIDIVLKNSYGRGHEALIESFLELNNIPYLGSNSETTFLGTSKFLAKEIFRLHNLPIAEDVFVDKIIWQKNNKIILNSIKQKIHYPCIVKDSSGTDSRGIFVSKSEAELTRILNKNLNHKNSFLVEKYISDPYEVTCMVVGNEKPLAYEPIGVNNNVKGLLTADMKDNNSSIVLEIPTKLPKKIVKEIKTIAQKAHEALGCKTFSRSDILVKNGKLYLLEVDVHPGFRINSATTVSAKFTKQNLNNLFLKFYNLTK